MTLEGQAWRALSVLSNLDALVTATQNALEGMKIRVPCFNRALMDIGAGVADTCKVMMAQLHQVVTLLRYGSSSDFLQSIWCRFVMPPSYENCVFSC